MGIVYLAWDPPLERPVAVKTIRPDLNLAPDKQTEYTQRFLREARLAAGLQHPNIVTIHDVGEHRGRPFFAMEFLPGIGLDQYVREGRNEPELVLDVSRQIAEGLGYAHLNGIVHRDVKPANILIGRDQAVKITDFGIARPDTSDLTHEGQMLGSPSYMAPEQIRGNEVGPAADLFSFAVVLYAWLTGKKPFAGENVTEIVQKILSHEPTPPSALQPHYPEALDRFFRRALAKNPEERFVDARGFYSGLAEAFALELDTVETFAVAEAGDAASAPPLETPTIPSGAEASWSRSDEHSRIDLVLHKIARSARGPAASPQPASIRRSWWIAAAGIGVAMLGFVVWLLLE